MSTVDKVAEYLLENQMQIKLISPDNLSFIKRVDFCKQKTASLLDITFKVWEKNIITK